MQITVSNYRIWKITEYLGTITVIWYHVQVKVCAFQDTWLTKQKFDNYQDAYKSLMYYRVTYDVNVKIESLVDIQHINP